MREAYDWYRNKDALAAEQFLEGAVRAMHMAAEAPLRHPLRFSRFRRIVMRRFPYAIFYDHDDSAIYVYYIFHGAQDPARLGDRLK